jgi:Restriction endonuclease
VTPSRARSEVDVAVRLRADGPVVAIFECRARGAVADVTWVEQVVTKARDLEGAPSAVLVSTSGFTGPARDKAAAYEHDVRLVTEVEAEEFSEWFRAAHVVRVVTTRQLHGCEVQLTSDDADDFAPATKTAIEQDGLDSAIFQRKAHPPLSARQLFEEWYARTREQLERDVLVDGGPIRRKVPIHFSDPERSLGVETSAGRRAVAAIALDVEMVREARLVPIARATRYIHDHGDLSQAVDFHLGGDLGTLFLHRRPAGPTLVRHRPPDR